jgi:Xaa-Pro aminopeptidase
MQKRFDVQTLQPVLKRGRNCWDKVNMPETEFRERVSRIKKMMSENGIDLLLLYGNGVSNYGNQCYISNYVPESIGGALVAVPADGEVTLIFEGVARGLAVVKSATWISDIRACGNIATGCFEYLKSKYPAPATLGIAGFMQLMPFTQLRSFNEYAKQYKVSDGDNVIQEMRMVKSSRESDQVRRASRIVRRAFDNLSSIKYSDINERIIEAEVERFSYLEGAEDVRVLVACPAENGWVFRPTESRQSTTNKTMAVYLAIAYEGYWAEGIRTYVIQPPYMISTVTVEEFQPLLRNLENGLLISSFHRRITCGLGKNSRLYIYLGNSIGLSLQEYPFIGESESVRLKTGMCFTLRVVTKNDERGETITGYTVLLAKGGAEILT